MSRAWRRFPTNGLSASSFEATTIDDIDSPISRIATEGFFENPATNTNNSTFGVGSFGAGLTFPPRFGNAPSTGDTPLSTNELGVIRGTNLYPGQTITQFSDTSRGMRIVPGGPIGSAYIEFRKRDYYAYSGLYPIAGLSNFLPFWSYGSGGDERGLGFFVRIPAGAPSIMNFADGFRLNGTTLEVLQADSSQTSILSPTVVASGSAATIRDGGWHYIELQTNLSNSIWIYYDGSRISAAGGGTYPVGPYGLQAFGTLGMNSGDIASIATFADRQLIADIAAISQVKKPTGTYGTSTTTAIPTGNYLLQLGTQAAGPHVYSSGAGEASPGNPLWNDTVFALAPPQGAFFAQPTNAAQSGHTLTHITNTRSSVTYFTDDAVPARDTYPKKPWKFLPEGGLQTPHHPDFNFTSGSWSISFVVGGAPTTGRTTRWYILNKDGIFGTNVPSLGIYAGTGTGLVTVELGNSTTNTVGATITSISSINAGLQRFEITCDGTTVYLFRNGTLEGSVAKPTMVDSGRPMQFFGSSGIATDGTGYIAIYELDIIKGVCEFTATHTNKPFAYKGFRFQAALPVRLGAGSNTLAAFASVGAGVQTAPPPDTFYSSNILLLLFDGTNGSTTIVDNSPTPKTVTALNSAQITTTAPRLGTGALALTGASSSHLLSALNSIWDFGSDIFTIEMYVKVNSGTNSCLLDYQYDGLQQGWGLFLDAARRPVFSWYVGATSLVVRTNTGIPLGTWVHVAVCRGSDGLVWVFYNGVRERIADGLIGAINPLLSGTGLYIGAKVNEVGLSTPLDGVIDGLRITRGVVRYPSTPFAPPESMPSTGGAGTATLNGSNTVAAFTQSAAGVVSVQGVGANTVTLAGSGSGTVTNSVPVQLASTTQVSTGIVRATGTGSNSVVAFTSASTGVAISSGIGANTTTIPFTFNVTGNAVIPWNDTTLSITGESWDDLSRFDHGINVAGGISLSPVRSRFGQRSILFTGIDGTASIALKRTRGSPQVAGDVVQPYVRDTSLKVNTNIGFFVYVSAGYTGGNIIGSYIYEDLVYPSIPGKGAPSWRVGINSNRTIYANWTDDVDGFTGAYSFGQTATPANSVPLDQWCYVRVRSNGFEVSIYLDGVLQVTTTNNSNFVADANEFTLGANSPTAAVRQVTAPINVHVTDITVSTANIVGTPQGIPTVPIGIPFRGTVLMDAANTTTAASTGVGQTLTNRTGAAAALTVSVSSVGIGSVAAVGATILRGSNATAAVVQASAGSMSGGNPVVGTGSGDPAWLDTTWFVPINNITEGDGIQNAYNFGTTYYFKGYGDVTRNRKTGVIVDYTFARQGSLYLDTPFGDGFSNDTSSGTFGPLRWSNDGPDYGSYPSGTFDIWFKQLAGQAPSITSIVTRSGQFGLSYDSGLNAFLLFDASPNSPWVIGQGFIVPGQWHFVAITFYDNPTTTDAYFSLYIGGHRRATVNGKKQFPVAWGVPAGSQVDYYSPITRDSLGQSVTSRPHALWKEYRLIRNLIRYTDAYHPPPTQTYKLTKQGVLDDFVGTGGDFIRGTFAHTGSGRGTVTPTPRVGNGRTNTTTGEITSFSRQDSNLIGGVGANTTAAFTQSATGTVVNANAGAGANTTAAFTQVSAGVVPVAGAGANTTNNTQSSAGVVAVVGQGANTTTQTSVGAGVLGAGAATGNGANTVAAFTQVATGGVRATGAGINTTVSVTQTGAGTATSGGVGANTVVSFTQLSTGIVDVRGQSVVVTTSFVVTSAGQVRITGNSSVVGPVFTSFGFILSDAKNDGGATANTDVAPVTTLAGPSAPVSAFTRADSVISTSLPQPFSAVVTSTDAVQTSLPVVVSSVV